MERSWWKMVAGMGAASAQDWLTDLFCDDVSMFVHELLFAHMLPRKIFNLFAL